MDSRRAEREQKKDLTLQELRQWLRPGGVDGPSERGLTALLRQLPELAPSADLADEALVEAHQGTPAMLTCRSGVSLATAPPK